MGGKTVLVSQIVCTPNMEVIRNNKRGCKLLYDMYTKKAVSKSTIRWECSQRASKCVSCSHPTIWRLIDCPRKDNINVETCLLLDSRGQRPPPPEETWAAINQETATDPRHSTLCSDLRDGRKTVEETLEAVGYCIRWKVWTVVREHCSRANYGVTELRANTWTTSLLWCGVNCCAWTSLECKLRANTWITSLLWCVSHGYSPSSPKKILK